MIEIYNDLKKPVRQVKTRVDIYKNSALVATYSGNDFIKSITIERTGEKKFFGFGVCQKANIHLISADIDITTACCFKIYFDDVNNTPNFYVTETHKDEVTGELSITAYDKLYFMQENTVAEIALEAPYTILDVLYTAASFAGLNVHFEGLTAEDTALQLYYENGANLDGGETLRELFDNIADAAQCIYYLSPSGIVFKRLDKDGNAAYVIDKASYFSLDSGDNRRISAVCSATELGDNVVATLDVTGTTCYVRNNPFWELREDITAIVADALAVVGNFTINQFGCNWRGNYALEIGDKIALEGKNGNYAYSYLLDDTITYDGTFAERSGWQYEENDTETVDNPITLGEALKQTYAKVDKANKQIDIVVSENESNKQNISAIQMTTKNIDASVRELSKEVSGLTTEVNASVSSEDVKIIVKSELSQVGVDNVITTTGFTFNENGLNVSKSGSEITTQITEDGMQVFRESGAVLTADNTGVKAENLNATTFLIIGKNSRLENYDNGTRTGCFWIS